MARKFRELGERVRSDPARRAAVGRQKHAMRDAMRLAVLRDEIGVTQTQLAESLEVTQANISRIERADDAYLSTLARYVDALGGRLEINAVFGDQVVPLSVTEEPKGPGRH